MLEVAVALLAERGVAGFTARTVAREAETSTPAVYELFGDKAGLVREVFFEGFRLLRRYFDQVVSDPGEPRADLVRLVQTFRTFVTENPVLAEVMFSRPFSDFDPEPSEVEAGRSVREAHRRPRHAAASLRASSKATRPTSPTCSSASRKGWPRPRPPVASARRMNRRTGAGRWAWSRCSAAWAPEPERR